MLDRLSVLLLNKDKIQRGDDHPLCQTKIQNKNALHNNVQAGNKAPTWSSGRVWAGQCMQNISIYHDVKVMRL